MALIDSLMNEALVLYDALRRRDTSTRHISQNLRTPNTSRR
jgi:hypothetical protein